jgi:superfamily II DNA or RNA helicase
MILRPRQLAFKNACVSALKSRRNTLGIAPTGAGKTVMLSAIAGTFSKLGKHQTLVLQHRDELVGQNEKTYRKVNPGASTSFYTADYKRWGGAGSATFSMIQTLARDKNLLTMPPLDLIVVDEAHHVASDSYIKVIEHARGLNPDVAIFGVTATPHRGDSRNLRATFDNVADQITLGELIRDGHLVKPRCFVIETGCREELKGVRKLPSDFDMQQVEAIMNKRPINQKIVEKWREQAGDRQTVAFTSTVQHGRDLMEEFKQAGVSSDLIYGDLPDAQRRDVLARYDSGKIQVLVNVMVLTEGWDHQPTSCVLLARPCSFKSTMIQMIGRGLRTVDPERYPGVVKKDCIVLDFGYSLLTHKDLEQTIHIESDEGPKHCPSCEATVPSAVAECPICGFEWPRDICEAVPEDQPEGSADEEEEELADFVLTEIELFAKSPFKWEEFFNSVVVVANALNAWAVVVRFQGRWVAVGGAGEVGLRLLADNDDRLLSLAAADDFLRDFGDVTTARKSKQWISASPSDKQMQFLGLTPMTAIGISRYRASCAIQWKIMERAIKNKLLQLPLPAGARAAA